MLPISASAAGETHEEDPDRLPPALVARAQALAQLQQSLEVDRLKLGELGVPDLVGGILSAPVANGDFATATIDFFQQNRVLFGLESPAEDLRVASIESDELGFTHVRLRQYHDGVRVMYGDLRAHFGNDQVLRVVNGEVLPDIAISTVPLISAEAARQQVAAELLVDPGSVSEELVVYEFEKVRYLAWRLSARVASPPGRWEYFVDATSGETIYRANRIQHEMPAPRASLTAGSEIGIGTGVMGDHKSHIDSYFDDLIYTMDDRTRQANNDIHGHNGSMPDTAAILTYFYFRDLPGRLVDDDDNIWQEVWQAPGVDAHVYASWVYDFLNDNVQRNGFDDRGSSMISTVEDGSCQNNAYWNGEQVSYCGVSTGFRPMSGGLDVVAHEWGHAVTEYTSNLVYEKESGALNESFSDMMGVRLRFAHDDPGWRIGRNFNGTGFRDMAFPRNFGDPDCMGGNGWIGRTTSVECTPTAVFPTGCSTCSRWEGTGTGEE
jgi:thermolysin